MAKKSVEAVLKTPVLPSEIKINTPENWCWARLIQLFNFIDYRGKTPTKIETGVPFITAKNIRMGYLDYTVADFISREEYEQRQTRGVSQRGDILFTTEAPMGNVAIADLDEYSAGQRVITFQKRSHAEWINNKFYFYYILSCYFQDELQHNKTGNTVEGIKAEKLMRFPVPVPPYKEQQRIVDRIEYLFVKLDEAKEKAQSVLDSFETRKAAILHKAFTGELTARWREAHSVDFGTWKNTYLKDLCDYMKAGGDKPADFVEEKDDNHPIPVIANGISNDGIIGYSAESKYDGETVTVSGRGTIGYSIYRNYPYYPVVRLIVLGPKKEVSARFIKYAFDAFPEEGTGSSIPQLTVPMIKEKVIPTPLIDEQIEIVRILDSLFAKEQQAKEAAEAVLEKIDLLKKSILARAFRGELGTNDPTEESAVELLKSVL